MTTQNDWTGYYTAMVVATASLTALLFVAISLRPEHFRSAPATMARASATFYSLAGALVVSLLEIAPASHMATGFLLAVSGVTLISVSLPFTLRGRRAGGSLRVLPRIAAYYFALLIVAASGVLQTLGAAADVEAALLGLAVLTLLTLGVTNAWILVLWREPPVRAPAVAAVAAAPSQAGAAAAEEGNGASTQSAEEQRNIAAFRRLIDGAFSDGDLTAVDEVVAPDCLQHQDGIDAGDYGGVKGAVSFLHRLSPDIRVTVEDITASGDTVWARLRGRGTHGGEVLGGPNARTFDITIMDVCRLRDRVIIEHWGVPDRFAQMQQLGLLSVILAPGPNTPRRAVPGRVPAPTKERAALRGEESVA